MRGRLLFLAGLGLGYVLGTRRGREDFAELKNRVQSLWQSTPVQETVARVTSIAKDKAPSLSAKVAAIVDKTLDKTKPTAPDGPIADG